MIRDTCNILCRTEIYARKMIPFFIFWKFTLSSKNNLISIESFYESFSMSHIEFSKKIIEEEHYWKGKIFFEQKYLDLFES